MTSKLTLMVLSLSLNITEMMQDTPHTQILTENLLTSISTYFLLIVEGFQTLSDILLILMKIISTKIESVD